MIQEKDSEIKNPEEHKEKMFITTDRVGSGEVWCYKKQRSGITEKDLRISRKQKIYN